MKKPQLFRSKKYFYYKCNNPNKKGVIIFVHGFSSSYLLHHGFFKFNKFYNYDYFAMNFFGHEIKKNYNNENKILKKNEFSEYSIYHYVDELVSVIKRNKFKNIILIGHSMGGGISLLVYSMIASLVKKIILISAINPAIYSSSVGISYLISTFKNYNERIKTLEIDPQYLNDNKLSESVNEYLNYEVDRFLAKKWKYLFLGVKLLSPILYQKLNKIYKELTVPTLFILGEKDVVIPKRQTIKYLKMINNPFIKYSVIKDTKHICFIEKFNLYNKKVWEFINSKK